jgi:hypothetical protein
MPACLSFSSLFNFSGINGSSFDPRRCFFSSSSILCRRWLVASACSLLAAFTKLSKNLQRFIFFHFYHHGRLQSFQKVFFLPLYTVSRTHYMFSSSFIFYLFDGQLISLCFALLRHIWRFISVGTTIIKVFAAPRPVLYCLLGPQTPFTCPLLPFYMESAWERRCPHMCLFI